MPDLFTPGLNCWRVERASHASMLVDCANYYRALYEAICKARHSIFVLGWDIDSRIELLRGPAAAGREAPVRLFELICWKARQNPDLQIYLNKWNYSLFFAQQREPLAWFRWLKAPPNVHYCVDGTIPAGASHHQKIIVVDDEIAFSGGMDIALGRWDHREHHPENPDRADPGGMAHPHHVFPFGPYHDIQMVVAGLVAQALAQLARARWANACRCETLPIRPLAGKELPLSWPQSTPPDFRDVTMAIARTVPPMGGQPEIREVEAMYLDEIARAERFIYIENQFLTRESVAEALNRRLRERPFLRALLLSCDVPKGVMEKKAMWTPRVRFREILEAGECASRAAMVYPISREDGKEDSVRIHSKIMIVDDRFLHLGSANLNNRSMGFDTECDLILAGGDDESRRKIAAIRTDLIREHSGREVVDIERLVAQGAPIQAFLDEVPYSTQHFRRIDDERYRDEKLARLIRRFGDPETPPMPAFWTVSFPRKGEACAPQNPS